MLIVESGFFWLVLLLPLATFLINTFLGYRMPKVVVGWLACGSVGLSFVIGLLTFVDLQGHAADQRAINGPYFNWFGAGPSSVDFKLLVDPLSILMVLIVTGVGFLIHVYSIGYMWDDPGFPRFFAYMNLFIVSMLLLVTADNYPLLLIGWEGVGLCSYFLISFWFRRNSAADAGVKAFVVNAIGDVGILIASFMLLGLVKSVAFEDVFKNAASAMPAGSGLVTIVTLLLVLGAVAKSAQIPLYTWLPDAMEGPTPVSALIHAATMVAAGVYLLVRSYPLLQLAPVTLDVIAAIGAITLLFSATMGLAQFDIKRVLAYSTISQLGYMFMAVGVGGFAAAMFHLTTHAFFKALLFLAAGSVIHALHDEQDMRKMGGIGSRIPRTTYTFLVGALALSGIFPFAGFWSKDTILGVTFGSNVLWWLFGLATTFITAFYTFRLFFMTFAGESRVARETSRRIHESPPTMMVPLYILAFFSIVAGFIQIPGLVNAFDAFLAPTLAQYAPQGAAAPAQESFLGFLGGAVLALVVGLAGIGLAYSFYLRNRQAPATFTRAVGGLYPLVANKYYVDEIYDAGIVQPSLVFSTILATFLDNYVIDGIVNGVATVTAEIARAFRQIQTGYVRQYALTFLVGIVIIVGYVLFTRA